MLFVDLRNPRWDVVVASRTSSSIPAIFQKRENLASRCEKFQYQHTTLPRHVTVTSTLDRQQHNNIRFRTHQQRDGTQECMIPTVNRMIRCHSVKRLGLSSRNGNPDGNLTVGLSSVEWRCNSPHASSCPLALTFVDVELERVGEQWVGKERLDFSISISKFGDSPIHPINHAKRNRPFNEHSNKKVARCSSWKKYHELIKVHTRKRVWRWGQSRCPCILSSPVISSSVSQNRKK